jgi:hypothetical protein
MFPLRLNVFLGGRVLSLVCMYMGVNVFLGGRVLSLVCMYMGVNVFPSGWGPPYS